MRNRAVAVRRDESICEDGLLRPWPDAARFLGVSRSAFFAAVDVLKIGERDLATLLATSDASLRRYRAEPSAVSWLRSS